MKHRLLNICLLALSSVFASCQQFQYISDVENVGDISVQVQVKPQAPEGVEVPGSFTVKLDNFAEAFEVVVQAGPDGFVNVDHLIPGIYTISASGETNSGGFNYNFNGNLVNVNVLENGGKYELDVQASKSGNIILKEIYYCGSKTPSGGAYFRDQFVEVYNNSNAVQYLDGMCIGNMSPKTATANMPVWPDEYKEGYVFFEVIWQVPGTGKDYPLQPGESAIIAQMGANHQTEDLNPACPVNLSGAEFETYVKGKARVPDQIALNMDMLFWPKPSMQWLVTVFGGAYGIFFPDEPIDPNTYVSPVGRTEKLKQVKIDCIMDAVELVNDQSKMKLKRVPAVLDAGASTVDGIYCHKSVSRKVKSVLPDGRIIYMDTNNSTEDFQVNDFPVVRRDNVKVPSWNTWAN